MRKKLLTLSFAALMALISTGPALAQVTIDVSDGDMTLRHSDPAKAAEESRAINELKKTHPGFFKFKDKSMQNYKRSQIPDARIPIVGFAQKKNAANAPLFANINTKIWANVYSATGNSSGYTNSGIYSFYPSLPFNITLEHGCSVYYRGVVQRVGNHLYGLTFNRNTSFVSQYDLNTDTWQGRSYGFTTTSYSFYILESAQAVDGTVYTVGWNAAGDQMQFSTIDLSGGGNPNMGQPFGTTTKFYLALGITNANVLYGIASDGNLYRISTTDGQETLVGATGLTLADSNGYVYYQTGEIDQRDNTFYWLATDANGKGGLYEVDLQTGHATLISETDIVAAGMIFPEPDAADGAPSRVVSASIIRSDYKAHNGRLVFDAPTTNVIGNELSNDVSYVLYDVKPNTSRALYIRGDIFSSADSITGGTASPGAHIEKGVYLEDEGVHQLYLVMKNSEGASPAYPLTVVVGTDTPNPVTNVVASNNADDSHKIDITWTAPDKKYGVNGGELDSANLVYDVYRLVNGDTTIVATNVADTFFVDDIGTAEAAYYTYGVQARIDSHKSSIVWTNIGVVAGEAFDGDNWSTGFRDYRSDRLFFDIIDANGDHKTWSIGRNRIVLLNYSNDNNIDDWLVTPPLKLKKNGVYDVALEAWRNYEDYKVSFEAKYGDNYEYTHAATKADSVNALKYQVLDSIVPPVEHTIYHGEIIPTKDGEYRIGVHGMADVGQNYLVLDSIAVTRIADAEGPDSVASLSIVPGNEGALTASVSFNVATRLINGDAFVTADSTILYRDGVAVHTFGSSAAGSRLEFTDANVPDNGFHKYDIVSYLNNMKGRTASVTVFIGKDIPAAPQNATLADNETNIRATWNQYTTVGVNGGYVNPDEVSTSFYTINDDGVLTDSITTSQPGATNVIINQNPEQAASDSTKTSQELYYLGAVGKNALGYGTPVQTNSLVVGPIMNLPYHETFTNGSAANFFWQEGNEQHYNNPDYGYWLVLGGNDADNTGGCIAWCPMTLNFWILEWYYTVLAGEECSLNTPKLSLRGTTNPKLFFNLRNYSNYKHDSSHMKVLVATPDGTEHEAANFTLDNSKDEWTMRSADLTPYINERYVIVKLRGIADCDSAAFWIDNINIFDQLAYNLKAGEITAPESIVEGKTGTVSVVVQNTGGSVVDDYSVVLYADDNAVDTVTLSNANLGVMETDTVSLTIPAIYNKESIQIRAQIVYASDLDDDDNGTETKDVTIVSTGYNKVTDLSAESGDEGVGLKWTEPVAPALTETTEDFDSYKPFTVPFGSWSTVDGDGGLAYGFVNGYTYNGQGTPIAFTIFNPNEIVGGADLVGMNPGMKPHSGNQFAGAPYCSTSDGRSILTSVDKWLISPQLPGHAQTIKFYAMNLVYSLADNYNSNFDVLYSTSSDPTDTTKYVKIDSYVADGTNFYNVAPNWKEFNIAIPEGAHYFAIRNTYNNWLLGIDDVTYQTGPVGLTDSIVGYNIYLDGAKIGSVAGDVLSYNDVTASDGSHTYNVTVLYQDAYGTVNESGFSNNATIIVSGIDEVKADELGTYNV